MTTHGPGPQVRALLLSSGPFLTLAGGRLEHVKVLVYEDNLLWSVRIRKSLDAFGHDAVLKTTPDVSEGDVAIVNLGTASLQPETLVPSLKAQGIYVIGHAGHKEKELHRLGHEWGCDRLATNSELTFKIETILNEARR